jgi:hypothetical protein
MKTIGRPVFAPRGALLDGPVPLALLVGIVFAWMFTAGRLLPIDYDEMEHAHAAWQMASGFKPYADFHEVHPPYAWMMYAAVLKRLPESFESVILLRLANMAASVLLIGVLGWILQAQFRERRGKLLALACLAIMILQPMVVQALCELRVDHLSFALTLAALHLAVGTGRKPVSPRRYAVSGFLFCVAMFLMLKLVLIPALAVVVAGATEARSGRKAFMRLLSSMGLGAAVGAAVMILICVLGDIDLGKLYLNVYVYHLRLHSSWDRFALLNMIVDQAFKQNGILAVLFLCGAMGLAVAAAKGRWREQRTLFVLAVFAVAQVFWVNFSFKQYLYSVYLAWSAPLALFFSLADGPKARRGALALLALLAAGSLYFEAVRGRQIIEKRYAEREAARGNLVLQWARPDRPVAAQPPLHPIFRRNATFFWIKSANPAGQETEEIMAGIPAYRETFSYEGYLRQLENNPPSLIIPDANATGPVYQRALADYAARHSREYFQWHLGKYPLLIQRGAGDLGTKP